MQVHGGTRLMALIGDPVVQARSPAMVNEALARRGFSGHAILMPLQVPANDLGTVLQGLRAVHNFAGAVITMPHKVNTLALIDLPSDAARQAGAVNVVRREADGRLAGTLLDGEGFVAGLAAAGHAVRGRHCVLAGAGGAASAVAFALVLHGCASLRLINRTQAKAGALAQRVRMAYPSAKVSLGAAVDAPVDLLVNGTSLGMAPQDALPFTDAQIAQATVVAECVVSPERTALLQRAEALGKTIHTGVHMLQAQIDLMIDFMAPDMAARS